MMQYSRTPLIQMRVHTHTHTHTHTKCYAAASPH